MTRHGLGASCFPTSNSVALEPQFPFFPSISTSTTLEHSSVPGAIVDLNSRKSEISVYFMSVVCRHPRMVKGECWRVDKAYTHSDQFPDPQIDTIDQQVEKHLEEIRQLYQFRNKLVPINSLPSELLSRIFRFCISCINDKAQLGRSWSFITVSYVCSHWRDVALADPALWSTLDFFKPAWVPEMLRRSKAAPLTVRVTSDLFLDAKATDAVTTALQHMSRISELDLCINSCLLQLDGRLEMLPVVIDQDVPLLHTLSLSTKHICGVPEHIVPLPLDFMNGYAPRLRHLHMRNFRLPWESGLLKNLTSLKITITIPTTSPSLQQLTDVLARMPGLEVLELRGVLPADTIPFTVGAALPKLSSIMLKGDVTSCANFLEHISFPSTTTMSFICLVDNVNDAVLLAKVSPMLSHLSKYRRRLHSKIRSLNICSRYQGLSISAGHDPSTPWLQFVMEISINRVPTAELAVKILKTISPLTHIRSLSFDITWNFITKTSLQKLLFSMERVQVLQVQHCYGAADVFRELARTSTKSNSVVFFPSLKTLLLSDVDFDSDRDSTRLELEVLKDALMNRFEAKAKVKRLQLETCMNLSRGDVDSLREICQDVSWDGMEYFDYHDSEDDEDDIDSEMMDYYSGLYY
ncbi:hypothetical protein D9758_007466 [Tetrapyrgos nigripes]|uniref:F-box domain-containing protein n=1 Tax=Tetrapyrgos nigripes TaxID=182062 RepID=A0A8H5G3I4_9AGAR|nr:hypothetical protein D9758_007466 [Tetrapyrgos nigripes]